MASLTIRNRNDGMRRGLRIRAPERGRSMEEEAREFLRRAVRVEPHVGDLVRTIHRRFDALGGVGLDLPERSTGRSDRQAGAPPSSSERMVNVLDTDVVPELMRTAPVPVVLDRFDGQDAGDLHLAAIVEVELRFGDLLLTDGRRKRGLSDALETILAEGFLDRILPFDSPTAQARPRIASDLRSGGRPVREADC